MAEYEVVEEFNSIALFSADVDTSASFYENYFNLELLAVKPKSGGYMLRNSHLLLMILRQEIVYTYSKPTPRVGWGVQPLISVPSVRELHPRLIEDGMIVESPITDIGYGEVFVLRDPDDYLVSALTIHPG